MAISRRLCVRWLPLALGAWLRIGHALPPSPDGARQLALPAPQLQGPMSVEQALQQRRSRREFSAEALSLQDVAQVLWAAQGVTDPSGHRTAPSAGARAPLELYLVVGQVTGLPPGVYRYDARAHALLAIHDGDLRAPLAVAAAGQTWMRDAPALLLIAAVLSRTQARYGNRGERYVQLEAGHAAQNVYLQCTARGLATVFVGAFDESLLRQTLSLPAEQTPQGLMPFGRRR
jgi:SagB-type dehydrogenase family enzyme